MKPFLRQDSQEMLQEQHTITYSIEPVNIIVRSSPAPWCLRTQPLLCHQGIRS